MTGDRHGYRKTFSGTRGLETTNRLAFVVNENLEKEELVSLRRSREWWKLLKEQIPCEFEMEIAGVFEVVK